MTATLFVGGHKETVPIIGTDLETLYQKIITPLAKRVGGDFADSSEVDLWNECFHLSHLNADNFNYAYELIAKACQNDIGLAKYQRKIDKTFKQDPRYTSQIRR